MSGWGFSSPRMSAAAARQGTPVAGQRARTYALGVPPPFPIQFLHPQGGVPVNTPVDTNTLCRHNTRNNRGVRC